MLNPAGEELLGGNRLQITLSGQRVADSGPLRDDYRLRKEVGDRQVSFPCVVAEGQDRRPCRYLGELFGHGSQGRSRRYSKQQPLLACRAAGEFESFVVCNLNHAV